MRWTRRQSIQGAAAALAVLSLDGCAAGTADEYDAAAARLRAAIKAMPDLPELVRFATLAANGHNTQPWKFAARPAGVRISADVSRRTPVVDPDDHHIFVSLGCATENLVVAASATGRACAVAVGAETGLIDIDFESGPARDEDLLRAIPLRQSTRSTYDGRAVPIEALRELEAAARVEGVSMRLITAPAEREKVLEHVLMGNSAQLDDSAFVAELLAWIRFDPAHALAAADGLYAPCSGNPVLPEWLGRRFFSLVFRKKSENDKYATQLRSSSGVAVFVGDRADREHWIRVGRSFERFALRATALGLRHAHINQPVEVPAVRQEFARWLGIGDTRPDLVVRFGHAPALPMSLRRPVQAVLTA